ncbi:MAG: hypothetical protein HY735_06130 [Verrucomicrobia bacterium]|nr:hypothetical protein [Verrucomicrobiota bacterium]
MSKANTNLFREAVTKFFAPLAEQTGLTLSELADGVYEIEGAKFAMRIRRGTGHRKDMLVTLLATEGRPTDLFDLSHEIGLGMVAEFRGERIEADQKDDLKEAENLAHAAQKFLVPYLLGHRSDHAELTKFVEKRANEVSSEVPAYRFPKNVRKEWL